VTNLKTFPTSNKSRLLGRLSVLIALSVLLLSACAPVRPNKGEPVSQSFADGLMQEWIDNSVLISSVQGLARVEVKAPMTSINGGQVIVAEKPDRLRAETLNPFGLPLVSLTAAAGQLGVLLTAQNLYYTGAATPENLAQFAHIPLNVSDLVSLLLYQPPLIEAWKLEAYDLKDGGWLLVRYATLQRQELVFNQSRQLVEVAYFKNNDLLVKAKYAKFREQGALYPALLTLDLPEKYATISLEFSDVETNGRLRPGVFDVKPPVGAKVVYLPK
jgi:hypothetical protein